MRLRNQLILAFFLFTVVPLAGVTLFLYYSSLRAFRQAVESESGALAVNMERRMGEVTADLQHRIDRVSGSAYWASLAPGSGEFKDWNALTFQVREELGDAADLLEQIEFTPVEPLKLAGGGEAGRNPELPGVTLGQEAAPAPVLIHLDDVTGDDEVVVEKVGDRLVVHRKSYAVIPEEGAVPAPPELAAPDAGDAEVPTQFDKLNQGMRALQRELEMRDQKRRAGIVVPVAQPEDFEFLIAREMGSAVLRDGQRLGTVRAQVSTRELLRRVLSRTRRERGEIPFAVDAEGNLYTPDPADLSQLEGLQLAEAKAFASKQPDPDWVTVFQEDPVSNLTFGIARPVGDSLDQIRNTAATNLGIGLALVGLALGGILPLSGRMTRNLERLTRGAERLAAGDLEARVEKRSRDEFGQLAETFNRMGRQLGEHQRQLVERERFRREVEISRQIQADLLPQGTYRSPQAHVRGIAIPAKELGGDFFNYFPLDGDQMGILVGDVSGKGVGAALLMANLQATLRARLPVARDLAELVDTLDREVGDSTPDEVYVTLFVGILDSERRELRYVNAGHTPPLAVHQDGTVDRLVSAGRPPGLLVGGGYREQKVAMAPGDSLFLYTDGLVEAEDEEGEPFGVERLQVLLVKEQNLDLEALLERVEGALREFSGPGDAADDATLVALKVPSPSRIPASVGA